MGKSKKGVSEPTSSAPTTSQSATDPVLNSATKRKKQSFSEFVDKNMGAIQQVSQFGLSLGASVADTVRQQKLSSAQTKQALKDIKSGGGVSTDTTGGAGGDTGGGGTAPSDKILGMSKPVFYGGIGVIILVAGVGIYYFATKSSGETPAAQ